MNQCSLCAGEVGPDGVIVCGGCQRRSVAAVRATGEFMAVSAPPDHDPEPVDRQGPSAAGGCTWCGKDGGKVRKLLGNGAVSICNECVALCADVMSAELGDGWRS